ncbi:MAG TPA: POTRA domain-containing protein [Polyangiaceae bacterium]|nr:POTRA domain-containing protein [Polyangiaceae bacterium]
MRTARLWRLAALVVGFALPAFAQAPAARAPVLPPALGQELDGRPIARVEVVVEGGRFGQAAPVTQARAGQAFSTEIARRAMQELLDTGRFADVEVEAEPVASGVVLRLRALPRRVVARIELSGSPIASDELLRGDVVRVGDDLTSPDLPRIAARVQAELARRGFPDAKVSAHALDTDDPLDVVLVLEVHSGRPAPVVDRWFGVWPDPNAPGLRAVLGGYDVAPGDRADAEALATADKNLEAALRAHGWHRATVTHRLEPRPRGEFLRVDVQAGPLIEVVFEGNRAFDADALRGALALEDNDEREPQVLADRLHDFYENRGFFDADIRFEERGAPSAPVHQLAFMIREAQPLRVIAREYPCLAGPLPSEVGSEIDSFLSDLPGSELLGPVDANAVDAVYGPTVGHGKLKAPLTQNPWGYYVTGVYDKAIDHLRDLFRSEGYLSASVGPATLLRRACDPHSQPGACIPLGPRKRPPTECRYDSIGLPLEESAPDPALTCHPDPRHGVSCEPEAVLYLPIKLGPRTELYDIEFEGNRLLVESELAAAAGLVVGAPISQLELENARRRLVDAYAEEGFAFAEVEANLELSSDHRHGSARFVISERQPVRVSRIDVRGAERTHEGLIRSRLALKPGDLYRRSLVRRSEELLSQLGVFSTVSVAFEDPYVPAREKVVVVRVEEKKPQYVSFGGGVTSGDGVTAFIEYGYRNVAGEAIQLTVASQLGYLPTAFIVDADVRHKYDQLVVLDRLERRNTVSLSFPEIGLGPLFRLEVSGVDVRDNARDYGLTRDATILSLIFHPSRRIALQATGSLERNVATIFGDDLKGALDDYVKANPSTRNIFRVPEGTTFAISEQLRASWDRRDRPLDATSGTFISLAAEHVHAKPIGDTPTDNGATSSVFTATTSDFMRYDGRIAGYFRLSQRGLALALSLRGGVIQQLIPGSRTYPDRLFFLGGIDSLRGFAQDSLVPEDIAQQLLAPSTALSNPLTIDDIVIRGGDVFINPRAELRIPLTNSVQTAVFLDSGNLWTDPKRFDPFKLRYTTGSGLRIATPIGPLAFDYGFNVTRVLDALFPYRKNQRTWESIGAFHFSIGVL